MRPIVKFSVNHPLLVNLLSIFLLVAGIIAMLTLRREAFPNISYDVVTVRTDYFGAPPEEIEKLVTIELEDELKEVSGVEEMNSISTENISMIVLELDPDEQNKDKVVNDIQRAVDRVDDLPEDAEDPLVEELQTKDLPVLNVSLSGDMTEIELQELARKLEIMFLDLSDVARVDRMGWRDREVWVEVDPERVSEDVLSLEEIITALKNQNLNLPGGNLKTVRGEFLVRTIGELENAEDVRSVIVRANDFGNWIRVEDVAEVSDAFEDDDLIEKTFGHRAINLTVVKKEKGDIIRLVKEVKETVDVFKKQAPGELKISFFDDYSYYVQRRLNVLKNNGTVGLCFVVLSLLIFLSRQAALMTTLGIPIALMTTFFVMQSMGLTINLITMFALIMVLGLVVDDAIVVSENVYRHMEEGMPPHEAAVRGTIEVASPVIVTVLTTIVAFIPLFYMGGIMGKYIAAIPVVVIIALTASLLECLVILPSHLAESSKTSKRLKSQRDYAWFHKLQNAYLAALRWVLGHRGKAVILFIASFAGAICLFIFSMKFILFPQGLIEEFFIQLRTEVGTSLEDMSERTETVEELVEGMSDVELKNFVTQIGLIREDPTDPYTERGSHLAQIHLFLTPEKTKGRRNADDIIEQLRKQVEESGVEFSEVTFQKVKAGPPVGKPISIRLRGDSFDELEEVAEKIKSKLTEFDGVLDIKDDFEPGKSEMRVEVDEEKASKAFLTIRDIATTVRYAIDGGVASKIQKTDEEIEIIVRYPEESRSKEEIFDSIFVPNKFDQLVPLNKIAKIVEKDGVQAVKHLDRKRVIQVSADVDEDKIAPLFVANKIKNFYEDELREQHPNLIIRFGGEQEETQKSLKDFFQALLLALFLIFIILASFFNSIILAVLVMSAIPFGLIGVIIAFFLHGQPLSFMALLGLLGLSGVVINDSIVLVSFINSQRQSGKTIVDSIMEAGRLRIRPVILTSITTVVGLMPVAYGLGGSDPFLKPMALAIGWGLVFSTVLTLLLIPCLYVISHDFSDWSCKCRDLVQQKVKLFLKRAPS